jgi:ABC-type phosphate/phosphonate transport system substrate-binding protein
MGFAAITIASIVWLTPAHPQQAKKVDILRIGTTGVLLESSPEGSEETAQESFRNFIKNEVGFNNEILAVDDYKILTDRLQTGKLNLGVFMGYEFAWALAKEPKLKPLAIAVNNYPYRNVHVMVAQDGKAAKFADLKGQTLAIPRIGHAYMRLFIDKQCLPTGKDAEDFFSKLMTLDNVELVLDEVVDGKVQAAVVDRVGLEAYKRRKPGRFSQLKELLQSDPLPPALVAYYDGGLDKGTLDRFRNGLITAHKKKEGQRLLDLYRLTSFDNVPKDFDRVLADTLKNYPPSLAKAR